MKKIFVAVVVVFGFAVSPLRLAADDRVEELSAADDRRVAAIGNRDKLVLERIFSEDLRYAHSTGAVDDKAGYVDLITSGRTKYLVYDYLERTFTFPAPTVALMAGKAHIKSVTGASENDSVLSYLAVWRKENGIWRFLAWQSCKNPEPIPGAK